MSEWTRVVALVTLGGGDNKKALYFFFVHVDVVMESGWDELRWMSSSTHSLQFVFACYFAAFVLSIWSLSIYLYI